MIAAAILILSLLALALVLEVAVVVLGLCSLVLEKYREWNGKRGR